MSNRPSTEEYGPYYETYIRLVPEGDIGEIFAQSYESTLALLSSVTELQGQYRYEPGKWSLKEVIGHVVDGERIMSYRLLRIARGDKTPLAGFDQDEYIKNASFDSMNVSDLLEDYSNVRRATLSMLRSISDEAWHRTGSANNSVLSARALAYIIVGHEMHHVRVIQERYLS